MLLAVAAVSAGCGSGDSSSGSSAEASGEVAIEAEGKDREIALDVQDYFERNCPSQASLEEISGEDRESPYYPRYKRLTEGTIAMCEGVTAIAVEDGVVTVRSDLADDADGKAAGQGFCLLIQGSDVADFTPGHELQDEQGETIEVCPARTN